MRNFYQETIEASNGLVKKIPINSSLAGDVNVQELWIQSDEDIAITVKSYMDPDEDPVELSAIDIVSLAKVESITEAGLYLCIAGAASLIEVEFGGSANVTIKVVY